MGDRTAAGIRWRNVVDVLRCIHDGSAASRPGIVATTGLSMATVASVVSELIGHGLVVEAERRSGGGRPRARLALDPRHGLLVGVDVAETYVQADLHDAALGRVATDRRALDPAQASVGAVVDAVVATVRAVAERGTAAADAPAGRDSWGVPVGRLVGIGVSVPGQVDPQGGTSVFAPNWGWHDVPLGALLQERLERPVTLDNPLKAIATAELWSAEGRGVDDLVVVNLGTGVGAGVAVSGALHRGTTNSAGEWGHTPLDLDGPPCRCGARGCVEAFVGAPAILAALAEIAPGSPLRRPGQTDGIAALAAGLRAGDAVAAAVVARTGRYLGAGLATLVNVLNPQLVVLAGWVAAELGDPLLAAARDTLARHALARPLAAARLRLSGAPGNPVSSGAATFALEARVHALLARGPAGRPPRPAPDDVELQEAHP